jgi:hypothetical protein
MFKMMNELDKFMEYKFINGIRVKTQSNQEKCRQTLTKIEEMTNSEYRAFDIAKTYILAKIYYEIENDNQKALQKFHKLSDLFPQNTIFRKAITDCKIADSIVKYN